MKYTESDGQITVTGGFEGRSIIEISEFVGEKPVTAVERYAFADRTELAEVVLPKTVTRIGAHAFYNCKNLRVVELCDGIRELEDGAFKNCYRLGEVKLHCENGREGCIKHLFDDNVQEVALSVEYGSGQRAKLLFPMFEDDYVENTPARIFQAVSYGSGGAYRQCMQSGTLDYRTFDGLFERSVREDRFEAALFNSVWRIKYPYRLSDTAKDVYMNFLREHGADAALYYIGQYDADAVAFLCGLGIIDAAAADIAIETAVKSRDPKISGILIDYKSRNFAAKRKNFDLW